MNGNDLICFEMIQLKCSFEWTTEMGLHCEFAARSNFVFHKFQEMISLSTENVFFFATIISNNRRIVWLVKSRVNIDSVEKL